jgi:hypothetical protein
MGIEPFACNAMQTWNGSCILGVIVGDSLTQFQLLSRHLANNLIRPRHNQLATGHKLTLRNPAKKHDLCNFHAAKVITTIQQHRGLTCFPKLNGTYLYLIICTICRFIVRTKSTIQ